MRKLFFLATLGSIFIGVSYVGSSYKNHGPDIVAPSEWSFTTDLPGDHGVNYGDYRNDFGGTSSAVAKVTGVVALMLSVNPDLKPHEVKTILRDTADDIDTFDEDDRTGKGRVNAAKAVEEARKRATKQKP